MEKKTKTKQQLLFEIEELRGKPETTERRLKEVNEKLLGNIAERKPEEETSDKAKKHAESILGTIREPLVVLNEDLEVISANPSFYQTFKVTPEETEGQFIYSIGNHQWDIPALRELLEEIIPKNSHFDDFEVAHEFPTIGPKKMLLNARRIYQERRGTDMILLAIEDITERKKIEEALQASEIRYRRLLKQPKMGY